MPARTLRIVHTVSSLQSGGMEHLVLRLVEAQRRRGHEAAIVALRDGPLAEPARARALPFTVLDGPKPVRVAQAARAFLRYQPDVLHAHNPTSLHYATVGALLTRAALVYTDHGQTRGVARVPRWIEWRMVDAAVGCSRDTADRIAAPTFVPRAAPILNGVDVPGPPAPERRAGLRAALGCPDAALIGVVPANLVAIKGHDVLLRALARVRDRGVATTVLLLGDGDQRPRLGALADALGLADDRLRFLGFCRNVPDLLAAADYMVLASRDEGLPLAVLEAMAAGLPVVVTAVGGLLELVEPDVHGLVVPADDPAALAAAIERLAGDPALRRRLGAAACDRVRAHFSLASTADAYERLYRDVVARRSAR